MLKSFLVTAIFLIGILVSVAIVKESQTYRAGAAASTNLSFQTVTNARPKVGDKPNVRVMISSGTNQVVGTELRIKYDATKLRLDNAVPGSFFPNPTKIGPTINNSLGTLSYTLFLAPGATPISGSGILATLNFTAIAQGTATISFDRANTIVTAINQGGMNVVNSLGSITLNISKAPGKR